MVPIMIRKFLLAAALLLVGGASALADCNGQFQPAYWCGNSNGSSQAPPSGRSASSLLDAAFGNPSAPGTVLNRGASLWSVTPNPVLGNPGSSLGSIGFANTTSGILVIQPPSGALGSHTMTLQAVTDTFVYRASTDTLTNKTLTSSTDSLGGVTMALGSDATGDLYYRNSSGLLTRLPIGSSGNILEVSGGIPAWGSFASSCTIATTSTLGCVKGDGATLSISGAGVISINLANANTWTNTVTITPPSSTTTLGLVVGPQSLPSSCSSSCGGPFSFNSVSATNAGYQLTGTTLDAFGLLLGNLSGFRVNLTSSGTNGATVPNAFVASIAAGAGTNPNLVGATLSAYDNQSSSGDAIWAALSFSNAGPSANILQTISFDAESAIATGGVVKYRFGLVSSSLGPVQASGSGSLDAAIDIRNAGTFTTNPNYATAISWHNGLCFCSGDANGNPLDSTGSAIFADGTFTTGYFVNMPNVTFATDIFNLSHFVMTGTGLTQITAASGNASVLSVTATSAGSVQVGAFPNGTSGFDGTQTEDSSTNNNLVQVVYEASFSAASRFGVSSPGNYAAVITQGSTNIGLMLGTVTSEPLIIGTNNTARMSWSGAGALTITLGSDATGDIYYRNSSGNITRLGIGATGSILTVSGGIPSWAAVGTGVTTALGTAINTNGGFLTGSTASVAAGALPVGAGSGTAATGVADVATGALLASGGSGSNPSYCTSCTISSNTGTLPTVTGGVLNLANADTNSTVLSLFNAGTGTNSVVRYYASRGTIASPSALQLGDSYAANFAFPYSNSYNAAAGFQFQATENMSSGHQGTAVQLYATVNGGALGLEATFQDGVTIGSSSLTPGVGSLLVTKHLLGSGTSPTVSSCGTSPSISGSDVAGKVTVGTGTVGSCTVTFGTAFGTAPSCGVGSGTAITSLAYTTTTTTLVITGVSLTSDVIQYNCLSSSWLLKRDLDPAANDNTPVFLSKAV